MASFRIWVIAFLLWSLELLLSPRIPVVWVFVDPLFLLLIFLGLNLSSAKFLWLYGVVLGMLKDVATAGLFGGYTCTFALMGWFLEWSRHLVEREDPLVQGVWVGLLVGLNSLVYGLLITLADPAVGWNRWWWGITPIAMLASGGCAMWSFPRLRQFLKGTR